MSSTLHYLAVLAIFLPSLLLADSPMFRADAAHSGIYDAVGVPRFSNIKWTFHTGGRVYSSPAIVQGTLYVGSTDHNLYALNLKDGTLKWKVQTASGVTSSPAVVNGVVFIGSYDGKFYALESQTGKMKWSFQTEGERRYAGTHLHGSQPAGEGMPDPFDFFLSSPTVWDGKVYFGSGDGNVYALRSVLWGGC